jgi:hypothetical protein
LSYNTNNQTQKIIIFILGAIILSFAFVVLKPKLISPPLPAGVLAPNDPVQITTDDPPVTMKKNTIIPKAYFSIEGKILSKRRYFWGKESKISPVDLAMGWGRMSDKNVVEKLKISQHGRWYFWKAKKFPIPRREIETHSANMHIIPASKQVRKKVLKAKQGQIVKFDGYLVRVVGQNWTWQSSLTRNDTGNNACEVVYVKNFEVLY